MRSRGRRELVSAPILEAVVALPLMVGLLLLDVPLFLAVFLGAMAGIVVRGIRHGWKE